jgi:hypothetical protein
LDDLLLEEWSAACVLMEVALASPDPDAYFDIRSRWRKVELTVVAVLGDTGTMELASDESPYLRALAARDMGSRDMGSRDMSAASGLLERLAADAALIVRVAVASNPATPVGGLATLYREGSWHIRVELASNPSSPSWMVTFLAGDRLPRVRAAVAGLPRPPSFIVAKLLADPDWHVRAALAGNKAVSRFTLGTLADDRDLRVATVGRTTLHMATRP